MQFQRVANAPGGKSTSHANNAAGVPFNAPPREMDHAFDLRARGRRFR